MELVVWLSMVVESISKYFQASGRFHSLLFSLIYVFLKKDVTDFSRRIIVFLVHKNTIHF